MVANKEKIVRQKLNQPAHVVSCRYNSSVESLRTVHAHAGAKLRRRSEYG